MVPEISIVIPVYNSQESLEECYKNLKEELHDVSFEIVFVDDASSDKSWAVLEKLKKTGNKRVQIIQLEENIGQHRATLVGFKYCSGAILITLDDDLQQAPSELKKLLHAYSKKKSDVVYGINQSNKSHSFFRNTIRFIIKSTTKFFTTHKNNKGSSFRLLSKDMGTKLVQHVNEFVFIEEEIHQYTKCIDFVEIQHKERIHGKSTYTFRKLFKLFVDILTKYCMPRIKQVLLFTFSVLLLTIVALSNGLIEVSTPFSLLKIVMLLGAIPFVLFCAFAFSICVYCQFNLQQLKTAIIPYKIKQQL
ncbi:MAG: glycosyltransferase [Flavobacteriaceae bacterium]|nr:glycosyltransferase [Flavobacteriaceae bacterium]